MFPIYGSAARLCDGISRRDWLRVGGLSALGLSLPSLLHARELVPPGILPTDKTFGRAKNVVFLYLLGGPPQHETFDPKPESPAEIRGAFRPIHTNVPGIDFCELLPRTARLADKLAIIRSMATDDNNHDSSGYWLLTGYKYLGPNSRTIQPTDWPYFGSLVKMLKPSEVLPPLSTVWLPDLWRLNENVTPAGQSAGFLGSQWNPDVFVGDPSRPDYQVQGLQLSDLPPLRLRKREDLLRQVESHFAGVERGELVRNYDKFQQQSFQLMTSGKAREAFDLSKEPVAIRQMYGPSQWSQSLLLARRLVEAGVRLVHVNWPREPGDNAVDNPLWDTHAQNADRVEDVLCPLFDVGFSAFITDLDQRGLLSETLVVAIGEFGRTPKINGNGGRDHWGPVFCCALAGAGISTGQAYGASDANGAYPARDRVQGGDLTATIFHLLGINYQSTFHDREGREHKLTLGAPVWKVLGTEPASKDRTECTGDIARVPPWDGTLLVNTDFESPVPLRTLTEPSRPKGWRSDKSLAAEDDSLGVKLIDDPARSLSGRHHAAIGFGLGRGTSPQSFAKGAATLLAQEVRSPFAGTYRMSVRVAGDGVSREFFESVFAKNFTCRLIFYQYTSPAKTPAERKELASSTFVPRFGDFTQPATAYDKIEFTKVFENPTPGGNFSFGLGLGVALLVEKITDGVLELPATPISPRANLRVDDFQLEFIGKSRKEDVKV
ncbi:MAG: DUF1501 domain-containing protein [Planctomycetales bacterium]|nr:DUF1501 domain-containing protein [Planctomycetales bacterium]